MNHSSLPDLLSLARSCSAGCTLVNDHRIWTAVARKFGWEEPRQGDERRVIKRRLIWLSDHVSTNRNFSLAKQVRVWARLTCREMPLIRQWTRCSFERKLGYLMIAPLDVLVAIVGSNAFTPDQTQLRMAAARGVRFGEGFILTAIVRGWDRGSTAVILDNLKKEVVLKADHLAAATSAGRTELAALIRERGVPSPPIAGRAANGEPPRQRARV